MSGVVGMFLVAAALLMVSGSAKLRWAEPTREAFRAARLPAPAGAAQILGAAEVALGVIALVTQARLAGVTMAATYAGFAVFAAVARHRGGAEASCGCFGRAATSPTLTHLAATAILAAVSGLQAVSPGPGLAGLLARSPVQTLVLAAYVASCTWLIYLLLAILPRVRMAARDG